MRIAHRALTNSAVLFVCLTVIRPCPQFNGLCLAQDSPPALTSEEFNQKFKDSKSKDDRKLVDEAVALTNLILGKNSQFLLQTSWKPEVVNGKTVVPVFLGIRRNKGELTSIAFVPMREQCIIVEAKELPKLEDLMGNKAPQAIQQEPVHLLTIALLHETGHLVAGDNGCFDQTDDVYVLEARSQEEARLKNERANIINNRKQKELNADAFVAKQLNEGKADISDLKRISKSFVIISAISMVSLNLGNERIFNDSGSGILGSKKSFWDKGMSHPNLTYRVLLINSLLSDDQASKKLVTDFEEMRAKVGPVILYRKGQADSK